MENKEIENKTDRLIICPNCGEQGKEKDFDTAIRQGKTLFREIKGNVIDVGFECQNCGIEFGFEHFQGNNWKEKLIKQ